MPVSATHIATVRAFNRDYTRRLGLLQRAMHDTPFSLTEARVLYEIAHRRDVTAAELRHDLGLDRGYLSRILKRFSERKLLRQEASSSDRRRRHLRLTGMGERCFAGLDRKSQRQVKEMLAPLADEKLQVVLTAMNAIHSALANPVIAATDIAAAPVTLRAHRPGDMGWVIERHGTLYSREYGWDERFEALVAQIAADFINHFKPGRERCWIAQANGRRVGCIFLVAQDETTAKLRLLLVEPDARGLGVGRHLVSECVQFAREAGYAKVVLWTQDELLAARHLYQQAGFVLTHKEPHQSFGHNLVAETWELVL